MLPSQITAWHRSILAFEIYLNGWSDVQREAREEMLC